MAVRLFVGNLSYGTTEADLRAYFGTVAPPSQVVLPVDRETGRPRGFAFVEFAERAHAQDAIERFNGQVFNGRPLAVSEARFDLEWIVPLEPGLETHVGLYDAADSEVPVAVGHGGDEADALFDVWRKLVARQEYEAATFVGAAYAKRTGHPPGEEHGED